MNLEHFFVTHMQDLSVVKPCIEVKEDFLPPVFILMEADDTDICMLRQYKYEFKNQKYWHSRFSVENTACDINRPDTLSRYLHRFQNRSVETTNNFILRQPNSIYMLQIFVPCKGTNEPDHQILRYVGKASTGLLERWCTKDTSHLKEIWKVNYIFLY